MADKIFYSWQSDTPNATNRGFIEDALQKAIRNLGHPEDDLYEPPREIELDKDTKGVPGTPPIAETIFEKIEQCAVFVPDLTFVAKSEKDRPSPNPNVLIEYGWALAKCGYGRIVGVMNTAYGVPDEKSLPFDLRHHTWPIRYSLPEDADAETRANEKKKLVKLFTEKIGEILRGLPPDASVPSYEPIPHKSRVSSFLDEGDVLCRHNPWGERPKATDIIWHDGQQLFLRLIPHDPIALKTSVELKELVGVGGIAPFGRVTGTWSEGNECGLVIFEARNVEHQDTANRIVQIGTHGEIWGIDGFSLRDAEAVPFDEFHYANALASYMRFAAEQLGVTAHVNVIGGFSGVAGMKMWRPPLKAGYLYRDMEKKWGNAIRDDVFDEIRDVPLKLPPENRMEIPEECPYDLADPWTVHAYKVLMPFFDTVWGAFQISRPEFLPK